jgi:uncharacterized membrane protein YcaP (DUF421 family)
VDSVVRAAVTYGLLLLIFRVSGKRSLAQITTFDFIVLLIISEAIQGPLNDGDDSLTNGILVVGTLMGLDIAFSFLKQRFRLLDRWMDDMPLVLVEDGRPLRDRMQKVRVDVDDVLAAGRELQGVERMDQIKYAVLERNGGISIIPKAAA